MFPQYWKDFLDQSGLAGRDFEVPEEEDQSGLGAEIVLMDEPSAKEEADECYPGIVVVKDGFIPVGSCSLGSGDPYFINENDGVGGALYRIYHDMVGDDGYDRAEAVVVVLKSYTELPKYIEE